MRIFKLFIYFPNFILNKILFVKKEYLFYYSWELTLFLFYFLHETLGVSIKYLWKCFPARDHCYVKNSIFQIFVNIYIPHFKFNEKIVKWTKTNTRNKKTIEQITEVMERELSSSSQENKLIDWQDDKVVEGQSPKLEEEEESWSMLSCASAQYKCKSLWYWFTFCFSV